MAEKIIDQQYTIFVLTKQEVVDMVSLLVGQLAECSVGKSTTLPLPLNICPIITVVENGKYSRIAFILEPDETSSVKSAAPKPLRPLSEIIEEQRKDPWNGPVQPAGENK